MVDVREAISAVKEAGVPSWSLDLMCGLPTLSMPLWRASLMEAVAADPDHVSVYDLQVAPSYVGHGPVRICQSCSFAMPCVHGRLLYVCSSGCALYLNRCKPCGEAVVHHLKCFLWFALHI